MAYAGLQPSTDIEYLSDYRLRHGLYRTDPGLQALTASAPLIAIWDDHEFENNVRTYSPAELSSECMKSHKIIAEALKGFRSKSYLLTVELILHSSETAFNAAAADIAVWNTLTRLIC